VNDDGLRSRFSRRRLLAAFGLLVAGPARAEPLAPGQPFDWPVLELLDGRTLPADAWADVAAVLVFWATWCPFCRRHNAHLEQLRRATLGQPLRVLGVAVESTDDAVRHYMAANDFHFPVVVAGGEGLRSRFTRRRLIPMTCLVDRAGRLVQSIPGEMAEDDVMALAALARDTPRRPGT
jgi:thiol-disulfide isomerase/thioredoxin